jgi:hypothetical protein
LGIKYRNQFDLVNGKMNMTNKWIGKPTVSPMTPSLLHPCTFCMFCCNLLAVYECFTFLHIQQVYSETDKMCKGVKRPL